MTRSKTNAITGIDADCIMKAAYFVGRHLE
jgi:hypothetical protein